MNKEKIKESLEAILKVAKQHQTFTQYVFDAELNQDTLLAEMDAEGFDMTFIAIQAKEALEELEKWK